MNDGPQFARIARRYDILNRVMSMGREQAWRRRVLRYLPTGRILDLGSGTGAAAPVMKDRHVTALDPVHEMLELSPISERVVAVGERLPFRDGGFDSVFSAYVFRNLTSVEATLNEVTRVLRPGGALGVVGLGRPKNGWAARVHRMGTAVVLPALGILSGSPGQYWYLHRSLDKLPSAETLFEGGPLEVERIWRMGFLGFVYGAVLRKPPIAS